MDSKKSMYFQNNTTTPSIGQLKKRLSNTKEAETIAKKAKRKNIDSLKETVKDSTVMDTILETSSTKSINTIQETAKESNLDAIRETQEQQSISFYEVGSERLKYDFFNVNCEVLAKKLLGKVLVRNLGDSILKGRIVETECYPGGEDKASHSCNGKKTPRNKPMFMKPGTCYVYLTYGMYHCFNISCQGDGAAVLIRALEPLEGVDKMQENRLNFQGRKHKPPVPRKEKQIQSRDLCNGPGKLTVALAIDREANEKDICVWRGLYIETSQEVNDPIVASTRIGIDSCGEEAVKRLWRYYLYGNICVSKFDRLREKGIMQTVADQT